MNAFSSVLYDGKMYTHRYEQKEKYDSDIANRSLWVHTPHARSFGLALVGISGV